MSERQTDAADIGWHECQEARNVRAAYNRGRIAWRDATAKLRAIGFSAGSAALILLGHSIVLGDVR